MRQIYEDSPGLSLSLSLFFQLCGCHLGCCRLFLTLLFCTVITTEQFLASVDRTHIGKKNDNSGRPQPHHQPTKGLLYWTNERRVCGTINDFRTLLPRCRCRSAISASVLYLTISEAKGSSSCRSGFESFHISCFPVPYSAPWSALWSQSSSSIIVYSFRAEVISTYHWSLTSIFLRIAATAKVGRAVRLSN